MRLRSSLDVVERRRGGGDGLQRATGLDRADLRPETLRILANLPDELGDVRSTLPWRWCDVRLLGAGNCVECREQTIDTVGQITLATIEFRDLTGGVPARPRGNGAAPEHEDEDEKTPH